MVPRQRPRPRRDPAWDLILAIDELNAGAFELQGRVKHGASPAEASAAWERLRDTMERHVQGYAGATPSPLGTSPAERAYRSLSAFVGQILVSWDLEPSERDRIEMALRRAARQYAGAEAAAA